jgi:hypothetical protein
MPWKEMLLVKPWMMVMTQGSLCVAPTLQPLRRETPLVTPSARTLAMLHVTPIVILPTLVTMQVMPIVTPTVTMQAMPKLTTQLARLLLVSLFAMPQAASSWTLKQNLHQMALIVTPLVTL